MYLRVRCYIILLLIVSCNHKDQLPSSELPAVSHLFSLVPASQSKISFQNTLSEGLNTNILMYEYFYNGGGVAVADFNNDNLMDIYFSGNMVDNKLYLNKGDLQFEDITLLSKVEGRPGPWKTGVTAVDINGDALMDLYVCYSGALPIEKRMNQLFVNKGNNTRGIPIFEDQAAQYGLNSPAYSTQAYFLDYDLDHDLDMLLLNHNPKNLPILNEASTAELFKQDDPLRGTRLFRQDQDGFKDVTIQAGINGSPLSYGLGIAIADLNEDGWPDFYVSNDYAVPDYVYLNLKNGQFKNELKKCIRHTSQFSMGNEVADINNDGYQDIVTLDMLPEDNRRQKLLLAPDNYNKFDLNVRSGFYYQYMRNMVQLNNGPTKSGPSFSEIGQLAGVANTDWSWSALLADFNNDGLKDLHVTNGYRRDYTNLDFINYMDQYTKEKGRLMREDVMDIIAHMPASNVSNYMFVNTDGIQFKNVSDPWGIKRPSNSNGAAYADLDNDGDLDLIVNNINEDAFIYRNETQSNSDDNYLQIKLSGQRLNTIGLGTKVRIHTPGMTQYLEQSITRGYQSSVTPILHFGLKNHKSVDTLIVQWPGGNQQQLTNLSANQTILLEEKNAIPSVSAPNLTQPLFHVTSSTLRYSHPSKSINDFDRQPLLIQKMSSQGPSMAQADLDQDGLQDIVIAASGDQKTKIYYQLKNKSYAPPLELDHPDGPRSYDGPIAIFDANGDSRLDIFIGSSGYHELTPEDLAHDALYLQASKGKKEFKQKADALPPMPGSKGCVTTLDLNGDGHLDLFIGGRVIPGRYPESPESFVLINNGEGQFTNQTDTLAPGLRHIGMVTYALSIDLNQDKKNDLLVVGEWLPISAFILVDDKLVNQTSLYFEKEYRGWWNTISTSDFNLDGRPDFIIGNVGTNMQFKVSEEKPAELYFSDFDKNGSVDPLFCTYIQGVSYPYITRDELLKQLAGFRRRFTSFENYADIKITDLFTKSELQSAGHLSINSMETTCFLSQPGMPYKIQDLPIQAQYAPVHTIGIHDYNQDGIEDLLLCGNNSNFKIRLGKSDANYGILLKGTGGGTFKYIDQTTSGLNLHGDVRAMVHSGQTVIFGINQQPLQVYTFKP